MREGYPRGIGAFLLRGMRDVRVERDVSSWIYRQCVREGYPRNRDAGLLRGMRDTRVERGVIIYSSAVNACEKGSRGTLTQVSCAGCATSASNATSSLQLSHQLHAAIPIVKGPGLTWTSRALELLGVLEQRGTRPYEVSANAVI